MKRLVILNPKSRNGRARRDFEKLDCERWLGNYELFLTRCPGDATERVREALLHGEHDQILVAGGDGSVNEAARGYWRDGEVVEKGIPLGVINLGTGGDFYKTLLKTNPHYFDALAANRFSLVDAGRVAGTEFLNISSIGMAGEMLRRLKSSRFQAGAMGYFYHTIQTLIRFQQPEVEIEWENSDGEKEQRTANLFNLFACNGCYSGGGMQWAPGASLTDGLLGVTIVSGTRKLPLVLHSGKVYSGKLEEYPGTETFAARSVVVRSKYPLSLETDGEVCENESAEVNFEIVPKVFPLIL